MPLEARYVPRRVLPALLVAIALFALGVGTAFIGVWMGWILAAFMLWTVWCMQRRYQRKDPVLTLDPERVTDHRIPQGIAWSDVRSMRTVNRRVTVVKVPLLELVPETPLPRDGRALARAVLRGDIAFADARDRDRLMIDLRHLDRTPEEVLAAAREHRSR